MSLREQLEELLPGILPDDPRHAIKGTELIRLIRERLPGDYSDASLRYHFSFMAAEPESRIAKVERGQGYYLRNSISDQESNSRGLLPLFCGGSSLRNDKDSLWAKALALVVRQYDTTGRGVFVFAPGKTLDEPSWYKPNLVVVDWPDGDWESGALIFDKTALERRRMTGAPAVGLRSVCLTHVPPSHQSFRQEFFRALSTALWTKTGELILVGEMPNDGELSELRRLSAEFGIGIICLEIPEKRLIELPGTEEIFRAKEEQCSQLLAELEFYRISAPKNREIRVDMDEMMDPELGALFDWIASCLERGRVEEYEFRVSSY